MKWMAKCITAVQALLLLPMGISKPSDAAISSELAEDSAWEAAVSAGTPEALQRFISQFPRGERLGDALDLIVQQEVATRKAFADNVMRAQLAAREPEHIERDFDFGTRRNNENTNEGGRLGPY